MTTVAANPAEQVREVVARAEALYEDLSFASISQWKAKDPSRKAVGFLPVYAPREVIHAAGAIPVGIMGGADRLEVVRGDSFFQSYICHLPRSVIEMALTGRLDAMDGFVFPSICDVIRNLSGMFRMMLTDRLIHYLDLPQNFDPKLGGGFYIHDMKKLAAGVSRMTGFAVTDARLRESIALYDVNRRAVRALVAARRERPWEIPLTEYYLMLRAGYVLPVEEHTAMLEEYVRIVRLASRRRMDNIRVLVRGAFCEQPPLPLLRTLERAGCYVVDDDFVLGARFIPGDVGTAGDPWEALSDAFLSRSLPTASKYDHARTKATDIVDSVRASRADGVIFMAPSFCDPALLDQPMLQKALDAQNIPYTMFKYSEDTGQFQVIREQAGTFSDAIKLWGTP